MGGAVRGWLAERPRLGLGLGLGLLIGGAEVALRSEAIHGLGGLERIQWWLIGVGTSTLLALAVAGLWRWARAPIGPVLGVLLAVHGALTYRYALVVNNSLTDPAVWGGILGILGVAAGIGWVAHRGLVAHTARLVRWALGLGLLTLPLAQLHAWPSSPTRAASGPNVVLITVDTVRPDRLSAYGADNPTPAIAGLAAGGARFETAVSTAPLTQPAHLGILTGLPPHITGVVANGTDIGDRPALLQRVLQEQGYQTAGFVGAFPLHGRFGWGQGMGVYDDDFGPVPGLHRLNLVRAWDLISQRSHTLRERRAQAVVDRAIRWLERAGPAPIFLWVHLFDPHAPYEAPGHLFDPPTDGPALALPSYWPPEHREITSTAWLEAAYDAEVRYTDAQVGRLLAVLRHTGRLDGALVVLTADHGESLTEHGQLFDHGDDLMAPSLRVPLIFSWPGEVEPQVLDCLASNLDLTPTVLGLLGIEDEAVRHGSDRSSALRGGDCTDRPVLATTVSGRFVDPPPIDHALRWPGAKRIEHASGASACWRVPDALDGEAEVPECPPGMAGAMDRALAEGSPPEAPRDDVQTTEALRALGYLE